LTTITSAIADRNVDALSVQGFLELVSVSPDLFTWRWDVPETEKVSLVPQLQTDQEKTFGCLKCSGLTT